MIRVALTLIASICALLIATTTPKAQSATAFDVASVKPNTSGDLRHSTGMRGRSFIATNVPVRLLILIAYDLNSEPNRLIGGPAWIRTDRFDVLAATPETAKPADRRQMVQALLDERFRLRVHPEMRERMPIYELKVARTDGQLGPYLRPSAPVDCDAIPPARRGEDDPCTSFLDDGVIRGRARTMAVLATLVSRLVDRPVVDRTGLSGNFNFDVKFAPEGGEAGSDGPSIFTALGAELGLKLESSRGPVDVLVIDSVERPTPD